MLPPIHDSIRPCCLGSVEVRHVEIGEELAASTYRQQARLRRLTTKYEAGTVCQLWIDGLCWMDDSITERTVNELVVERASGDVLVCGLGLGLILGPILNKDGVASVVVVDNNPGVIELVSPQIGHHPKLSIVECDARRLTVDRCFDTIWTDIWPAVTSAAMADMRALHRRLRVMLRVGGWMGSWLTAFRYFDRKIRKA